RTYSIGFDDPRFDETPHAQAAAARFGTDHTVQVADPDTTRLWPHFIHACDQPHGDVSFMPMGMVSALATRDVKMVLTGDGGDELFAGYTKYLNAYQNGALEGAGWPDRFARTTGLFDSQAQFAGSLADAFASDPWAPLAEAIHAVPHQDPINQMLFGDTTVLLPGNNLVKPDRMAMAHSLEVRSPFLDYRMAEFAFRVPGALKLAGGETKAIYKSAMKDIVGEALTYRAKQMFTVPIGEWFKQALAGYCREILLSGRFAARGLVAADWLERLVEDHIGGRANHTREVRALISLELWFRLFIDQDPDVLAQARMP
ncbi:MAG: asparagine synthase C-terminal domain-containing protein, partial [Pseudomonadota bacterium]